MATLEGKAWRYGDNVNTDVIIPARYMNEFGAKALAAHCMADLDPEFAGKVKAGDIMVAGANFGCGSSREHAPVAIMASGIAAIVAKSFARIFYRNAINIGFPILECPAAAAALRDGDEVEVDLTTGAIRNLTTGDAFQAEPFPPFIQQIIQKGGLFQYLKESVKK